MRPGLLEFKLEAKSSGTNRFRVNWFAPDHPAILKRLDLLNLKQSQPTYEDQKPLATHSDAGRNVAISSAVITANQPHNRTGAGLVQLKPDSSAQAPWKPPAAQNRVSISKPTPSLQSLPFVDLLQFGNLSCNRDNYKVRTRPKTRNTTFVFSHAISSFP